MTSHEQMRLVLRQISETIRNWEQRSVKFEEQFGIPSLTCLLTRNTAIVVLITSLEEVLIKEVNI